MFAEAEPLFQRALHSATLAFSGQHPLALQSFNNLGLLYWKAGRNDEAEETFRETLERRRAAGAPEYPDLAVSLNNLALAHLSKGDIERAEPVFRQSLEIRRSAVGEAHPDYEQALFNLATLLALSFRYDEALEMFANAARIDDRILRDVSAVASAAYRLAHLDHLRTRLDVFIAVAVDFRRESPTAARDALNMMLRRKGLLSEAFSAQREIAFSGRHPEAAATFRELVGVREELARALFAHPEARTDEHVSSLRYRADRLESDLARYVPAQYVWNRLEESNLKLILAAIPPATGVVEIVRCNRVELGIRADSSRYAKPSFYAAFVLGHSDQESVKMIDLGDAETIDSAIVAFRKTVSAAHSDRALSSKPDDAADQYSREAGRLRRMVWEPILGALVPGCRRLYLAPDGDLSTVPFELMRDGDGRYAYDDFTISYLATSRDLPRQSEPSAGRASAPLVMADPDFDLDLGAGSAAQQPKTKVQQRDAQSRAWKGRSVRFSALPGSRLEGEQVARLLGVEAKIGKAAVESVLKTARSPRILHIATHGFFLEDQALTGSAESSTRATASVEERLGRLSRLENPLLRSGLALAGANAWLAGRQAADAEDGIVTAEDIAIMDLQNTDLVVLSACDTGLGEIHRGEGVFGLRQAFAFAGAKTLIMSLWKVPDLQTSELMVAMYERLTAGASKIEALRGAQEQVRKEYPHPAAWGAFILLGNPT